jgi:hypothetical protein
MNTTSALMEMAGIFRWMAPQVRTAPPWAIAPRWPDRRSYWTQQRAAQTRRNVNARRGK